MSRKRKAVDPVTDDITQEGKHGEIVAVESDNSDDVKKEAMSDDGSGFDTASEVDLDDLDTNIHGIRDSDLGEEEEESDDDEDDDDSENSESGDEDDTGGEDMIRKVYIPDKTCDEELVYDPSCYVVYARVFAGFPCLSIDVLPEAEESNSGPPYTVHLVAGTQAPTAKANKLCVMQVSDIKPRGNRKNQAEQSESEDESADESSASSGDDDEARLRNTMRACHIGLNSGTLRTRAHDPTSPVCAISCEDGSLRVFSLAKPLSTINHSRGNKHSLDASECLSYTWAPKSSKTLPEAFGLDWNKRGVIARGDTAAEIHLFRPNGSDWTCDMRGLKSHTDSVEDLQWSPAEENVLASCSVDRSIKIWDTRTSKCQLTAADVHTSDINVIGWSALSPFLASGGDDGVLKVWDLRNFGPSARAVAVFSHHTGPITSVGWSPHDSSVVASAGEDDQLCVWDLAVERDEEAEKALVKSTVQDSTTQDASDALPPQLLFIHQGQKDIKELRWHPSHPGLAISTAADSIDIFKSISM